MKKALVCIFVLVLASCSNKNKELICYSSDWMGKDLLNEPYRVEYDQKELLVREGKDTIFYCIIDSISKDNVYINDYNVKFINRDLYYTEKGKFVKDNKVLTVKYQEIYAIDSLGNYGNPIEYIFDNWDSREGRKTFHCINQISMEEYKEFIKIQQSLIDQ